MIAKNIVYKKVYFFSLLYELKKAKHYSVCCRKHYSNDFYIIECKAKLTDQKVEPNKIKMKGRDFMATKSYTRDFNLGEIEEFIQDLENVRDAYDDEEESAFAAGMIFTWFGIIGGPAGVCVTASILTGALAYYFDTVQNTITTAISELEDYKDLLESNSNYNLVRMKVTMEQKKVNNTTYLIPKDFEPLAIHSINPSGWILVI